MNGLMFTAWPEMLAWPYLILKGWLPYRDIAIAHTPLLLYILALFYKIAGVGILQLKILTIMLIALNTFLTYFIALKIWNKKTAILAALIYLPLVIIYQGYGLWFDLALVPFSLLLFYFVTKKKYVLAGLVFALGVLTKQTFVYFLFPVIFQLLKEKTSWLNLKEILRSFLFGFLGVISVFLIIFLSFGILDDFYFWAVTFGVFYLPSAAGQIILPTINQFLAAFVLVSIVLFDVSLLPWVFVGLLGVYPRWELFHFQPALPFLVFVIARVVYTPRSDLNFLNLKITKNLNLSQKFIKSVFIITYFVILGFLLLRTIVKDGGKEIRFYETDVRNVSAVIDQNTNNNDLIYTTNYWDNLYPLTNTLPATKPLIPFIPWYLDYPGVKESILSDLRTDSPKVISVKDLNKLEWKDLQDFIERYYDCSIVEGIIYLCSK